MPLHDLERCKSESLSVFLAGYARKNICNSRTGYRHIAALPVSVPRPRFCQLGSKTHSRLRTSLTPPELTANGNHPSARACPPSLAGNVSYVLACYLLPEPGHKQAHRRGPAYSPLTRRHPVGFSSLDSISTRTGDQLVRAPHGMIPASILASYRPDQWF